MASTWKGCEDRFKPRRVCAGARKGSSFAGIVVAGASWRISSRNGYRDNALGERCCATLPGTCGVARCRADSGTCGVTMDEKLFAIARNSVSLGMLTLGRGAATGNGDAAG